MANKPNFFDQAEDDVAATVTVGNVSIDDSSGQYDESSDGTWTDYIITNRYEKDHHKYMLGIANSNGFQGQTVAFVQLASPMLLWICDWTAAKAGKQPEHPSPDPPDTNWVLLDENYEPFQVVVRADGLTPIYRLSGTYVYGCKNPMLITVNDIRYPRPAWLKDSFDRTQPTSKSKTGIKDGSGGNSSSGSPPRQPGNLKG